MYNKNKKQQKRNLHFTQVKPEHSVRFRSEESDWSRYCKSLHQACKNFYHPSLTNYNLVLINVENENKKLFVKKK